MNKMRCLIVASAAVFFGFAAVAETQAWSGTQTFTANTTILDPVTLDGVVTVSVAPGVTVLVSNEVSNAEGKTGKITLVGGGTLELSHTNSFTGGAFIDTGVLKVTVGNAVGTGDIVIDGGTDKQSQLFFGGLSDGLVETHSTISFPNKITVNKSGDGSHFQIRYSPYSPLGGMKKVEFTSEVSCSGDLYFMNDNQVYTSSGNAAVIFDEEVVVDGELHFSRPSVPITFSKAIKVAVLSAGGEDANGGSEIHLLSNQNQIGQIHVYRAIIDGEASGALGGASVLFSYYNKMNSSSYVNTYSLDHTLAYLATEGFTDATANRIPSIYARSGAKTLTLTGGVDKAVFWGRLGWFAGSKTYYALSLKVDASAQPDFTQVITNGTHMMNGTITVDAGHLVMNGNTSCTNVTGIVVNGGSFTFDTTYNGDVPALNSLNALTVKKDAKLTLKGANLFKSDMSLTLTLESGAIIDIPDGTFNVSSLTVDGRTWAAGQYTRAMLPMLPDGVILNVTAGAWGTETTSVNWTGEGSDNATTTADNWSQYVPIKTGVAYATLTGGDGMDYDDGDWFNGIVNDITPYAENKVAPFVIRPTSTNESAILHLSKGINSDEKTQLVLSGHITDLPEQSTASDNRIYYTPSTVIAGVQDAIQPTCKTDNGVLPLVLKNVTLDMPLNITGLAQRHGSKVVMMSYLNTTNVIKGTATIKGYTFYLAAETNSVIRFLGGLASDGNLCYFKGAGEYEIHDKLTMNIGTEIYDGCTLSLNTTNSCGVLGKDKREGIVMKGGTLNMLNDNVLRDTLQVAFDGGVNVIELNATTQTVGVICCNRTVADYTQSHLHGDYPALLKVTGKHRETTYLDVLDKPYWNAKITGGISIHFTGEGTNEVFTLAGRNFESCGDLEVSGKTLELASDASWLNGTNFTARGEGTLKFGKTDQVSKDFAQLHIAGNGKVEIPEGVTVTVSAADLDGTAVDNGSYKTGDEGISAHITGSGTLKVGQRGTALILQ